MKYISSQSYHTLNHWQSGRKVGGTTQEEYLPGIYDWIISGLQYGSRIALFPWSWHEEDATEGTDGFWTQAAPVMKTTPDYGGYYKTPAGYVFIGFFSMGDILIEPESIVQAMPYKRTYTISYAPMTREDGKLFLPDKAQASAVTMSKYSWTTQATAAPRQDLNALIGPVLVPTVSRWYLYYKEAEEIPEALSNWQYLGEEDWSEILFGTSSLAQDERIRRTVCHFIDTLDPQVLKVTPFPSYNLIYVSDIMQPDDPAPTIYGLGEDGKTAGYTGGLTGSLPHIVSAQTGIGYTSERRAYHYSYKRSSGSAADVYDTNTKAGLIGGFNPFIGSAYYKIDETEKTFTTCIRRIKKITVQEDFMFIGQTA